MLLFDDRYSATPEMVFKASPKLVKILFDVVEKWNGKFDVLCTSIIRKHTTDSGIHAYGRAVDFLLILKDRTPMISAKYIDETVDYINGKYPYSEKYKTIQWHSVGGGFGTYHFHLQVKDDLFFRAIA